MFTHSNGIIAIEKSNGIFPSGQLNFSVFHNARNQVDYLHENFQI